VATWNFLFINIKSIRNVKLQVLKILVHLTESHLTELHFTDYRLTEIGISPKNISPSDCPKCHLTDSFLPYLHKRPFFETNTQPKKILTGKSFE
jgi:hypothetical protein